MLAVLDKSKIPNYANINPVYHGAYYDPNDQYSIPYAISISFLLVNPEGVESLERGPLPVTRTCGRKSW